MSVEIKENPTTSNVDNDENELSHIVRNVDQMAGYVEGKKIIALCGHMWIPTRDPELFPICEDCLNIYKGMMGKDFGS